MRLTVSDLMTQPVTISPKATLSTALATMVKNDVQELYVVGTGKKLLGILPDYELLKAQLAEPDSCATVEKWMITSVETVSPKTDLAVATNLFRAGNCSRIAVMEKGKLLGMVSRRDVLRLCMILRVDAAHTVETEVIAEPTTRNGKNSAKTTSSSTKTAQAREPKFMSRSRNKAQTAPRKRTRA